ncbi:MAG: hypothetical protein V1729_00480 [Candidatus Woesearchaeota archaeon]
MVVNPKTLLETVTAKEKVTLKRLEEQIDEFLKERFDDRNSAAFGVTSECTSLRHQVYKSLLDKYRTAGWNVKEVYDQRDGDYIQFSYARRGVKE